MSSQAGSPPGGDSALQLPSQAKKRGRKEGGGATTSKARGKAKAKDGDADEQQQQQRRQSVAPQSAGFQGDSSLSRSYGGAGTSAAGVIGDERPAKSQKTEKRGQQKLSRKNLFAKECE